jgi:alpha-N-arabinofuranosidase
MNTLQIDAAAGQHRICRHIFGHFAEHLGRCIYEGIWVGTESPIPNTRGMRSDVIEALKRLKMPNLRWPGGCFADTYHWKDGIGPRQQRPSIVNVHWGGTTESNHFGTHEFLDLCELLGCEPYICGNVGSGTVQEMSEWLEYITMGGQSPMADLRRRNGRAEPWNITYWAVGNENWGCGGNMTAEHYANEYRRYQTYCRRFGGGKLYRVACGHEDPWNETAMRLAANYMDGLSVHYYTVPGPWSKKGSATNFSADDWFTTLRKALGLEDFINRTGAIMDRWDPQRRIGMVVDEWGTWFDVEPGTNPGFLYQQNTIRDALVAGVSLNILGAHADRVHMANIAQTINVLQAMILTDGARMLCTPTYHVFEMYKVHQDGMLLPVKLQCDPYAADGESIPQVHALASRDADGKVHLSVCNLHVEKPAQLSCELRGANATKVSGRVLCGSAMNALNTFDKPDAVRPEQFDGAVLRGGALTVKLPPHSVAVLEIA